LKKRTKKLSLLARASGEARDSDAKVFCFFSSEKKASLPFSLMLADREQTLLKKGGFCPN
jgi:hypothetical protein